MSVLTRPDSPATARTRQPIQPGLDQAELERRLVERFGLRRDPLDRWDLSLIVPAERLREVVVALRDDPELLFTMLLDVVGIDYLSFPQHRGPRFAMVYPLKSLVFRHRLRLKVEIDEDRLEVPSLHDLFHIADWAEREAWDQFGIVFAGHPNLKRLLNHHEFVGHPLRKDYPVQKRQKLSISDPMLDQLQRRLEAKGWTILSTDPIHRGQPIVAERIDGGSADSADPKRGAETDPAVPGAAVTERVGAGGRP